MSLQKSPQVKQAPQSREATNLVSLRGQYHSILEREKAWANDAISHEKNSDLNGALIGVVGQLTLYGEISSKEQSIEKYIRFIDEMVDPDGVIYHQIESIAPRVPGTEFLLKYLDAAHNAISKQLKEYYPEGHPGAANYAVIVPDLKKAEEVAVVEEARQQEEGRRVEEEIARKVEEAQKIEVARKQEEARRVEEEIARKVEEAQKIEVARKVEEVVAKKAEIAKKHVEEIALQKAEALTHKAAEIARKQVEEAVMKDAESLKHAIDKDFKNFDPSHAITNAKFISRGVQGENDTSFQIFTKDGRHYVWQDMTIGEYRQEALQITKNIKAPLHEIEMRVVHAIGFQEYLRIKNFFQSDNEQIVHTIRDLPDVGDNIKIAKIALEMAYIEATISHINTHGIRVKYASKNGIKLNIVTKDLEEFLKYNIEEAGKLLSHEIFSDVSVILAHLEHSIDVMGMVTEDGGEIDISNITFNVHS